MAKNEETVDHLEAENRAAAERVNYTHRLVGMHEAAPPAAASPSHGSPSPAPDVLTCPKCGTMNPAVMNRSDGTQCYRCDNCAYQWGKPAASADSELPPVPAIDAPGG
jgi:hypothetical protein